MNDDLIKRLRDLGDHASFEPHMHHAAADRIEELSNCVAVLEAKLAKAVDEVYNYDKAPTDPHHGGNLMPHQMQRRIEELEAEIEWWKQDSAAAWDKCEDYRVKLEKATAALNFVVAAKGLTDPTEYGYEAVTFARTTLAAVAEPHKLKSENT